MVNKIKNSKKKVLLKTKSKKSNSRSKASTKKDISKNKNQKPKSKKKIESISKKTKSKIIKPTISKKRKFKEISKKEFPDLNNPSEVKKYLEKTSLDHDLKKSNSKCFFKSVFDKSNFYKFLWFPFLILTFILIINFILEFILYKNISLMQIHIAKNALFFSVLISTLFIVNLSCYFYLGTTGSSKNYRFQSIFPIIIKLVAFLFFIEIILLFISYFTFMQPYLLLIFKDIEVQKSFLLYSIFIVLIKSLFYLITFSASYFLYSFTKFREIKN
jgi:hypothetical protein